MSAKNGKISVAPARYAGAVPACRNQPDGGWQLVGDGPIRTIMRNATAMYVSDEMGAPEGGVGGGDILASGLRLLRSLERHMPVDLPTFAHLNALPLSDAARFMLTFQICGYASQLPFGELYVLTPQAISIVSGVDLHASPTLQ